MAPQAGAAAAMSFSDLGKKYTRFSDEIEGNRPHYLGEDSGDEIHKICLQIFRDLGGDLRGGVRGLPARPKTTKENARRKKGAGLAAVYTCHSVAPFCAELPYRG
jgi:hypothetical protein